MAAWKERCPAVIIIYRRNKMGFEILCVTMHQTDFSKIQEMNIHSNVVFANQCDYTAYDEMTYEGNTAKMISTQTRGVGVNRNLALCYASADICLLADDDVTYVDDMENIVTGEFEQHPDADIIVFHFETNDRTRQQKKYGSTRKHRRLERMPWGTFRIAFRLNSVRMANVWFSTLFGGGAVFASGEDSMFLSDLKRKGLTFYVSKETIGTVSFEESTWFGGYDEKYYLSKGAYYQAVHPKSILLWKLYFLARTREYGVLSLREKWNWMGKGQKGYKNEICILNNLNSKGI